MQLQELNLNRFLYRDVNSGNPDTSITTVNNATPAASGGGGSPVPPPGSLITSVILQSSPSDYRIEINPDDTLKAYNNGNVILLIDSNGIVADNATFTNLTVTNFNMNTGTVQILDVQQFFNYRGIRQPMLFTGLVSTLGTGFFFPTGWSVIRNSVGIYTITHNLNVINPQILYAFTAPITGHFRVRLPNFQPNSFEVNWQQTNYGNRTFPVSGGPGTVTVQGVRLVPGEVPVDVGFYFLAVYYP